VHIQLTPSTPNAISHLVFNTKISDTKIRYMVGIKDLEMSKVACANLGGCHLLILWLMMK
jgi:hypothetical protein